MKALDNKIPPPIVMTVVGAAMVGIALIGPRHTPSAQVAIGAVTSFAGLSVAALGAHEFRKEKTTINPVHIETASVLVTSGIFSRTRNPMYLGFVIILVGLAIALGNPLGFIGPIALMWYLNTFQIGPEEKAMANRFGPAYLDYKKQVRRW